MERPTRKTQAQATKQRIFDIAVRLIKTSGYEHVTVSQICQVAGIAKGSFYVHYASKEDIVRESYYADLSQYMEREYAQYLTQRPSDDIGEKISRFLLLELAFADYAGYELTCLAYALNLGGCVPGPSPHLQRRTFTQPLHELLAQTQADLVEDFTADDAFLYLESIVRGIMASWCFSNHQYDIQRVGEKQLRLAVKSVFR